MKSPPLADYDSLFDDAWFKWGWAVHQAQALENDLVRLHEVNQKDGLITYTEYNAKIHGFSVLVEKRPQIPVSLNLRLGDMLHNFRSSLDNAAWAAVCRGATPPETLGNHARRQVGFPCSSTLSGFSSWQQTKIPGVLPADLAVFKSAQPCSVAKGKRARHVLFPLVNKNNLDKHQVIQPVLHTTYDFTASNITATDCIIRRVKVLPRQEVKVNAELARIYARRTGPNPELRMQTRMLTAYRISDIWWLDEFIQVIQRFTTRVLSGFSEQPLDLLSRLGADF